MEGLELRFETSPPDLEVQRFVTREAINDGFSADVWAVTAEPSLDLEAVAGKPISFVVVTGDKNGVPGRRRVLSGVCRHAELVQAEPTGVSTYRFQVVARLWLLSQRRGHRIFQHKTPREIVEQLLGEWQIASRWVLRAAYRKLYYKVQYGETDLAFVRRILSEAGIALAYVQEGEQMELVLSDSFQELGAREGAPIPYVDNPNEAAGDWFREHVSRVHVSHAVRPGKRTDRDYDFRRPDHALFGRAPDSPAPENRYEQYHYTPGGFLVETAGPGGAPQDDTATARHDDGEGAGRAVRELEAQRADKLRAAFETNVLDLWPSILFHVDRHPHPDLPAGRKLMLLSFETEGYPHKQWSMRGVAVFADVPYRPPLLAERPRARLQSAVVVGPSGQEIHTDEYGRVRVQFPWDREGEMDPRSTPWIRVSQGWGGAGYGLFAMPRIGQEVLIDFLHGDPEHPMIVGRVFNAQRPALYATPEHKTRSGWKSESSIGGNGYNEIWLDDDKGREMVSVQAEKNLRHLVKNDEFITVGNDRDKTVEKNEIETTWGNRIEVTGQDRSENTGNDRLTAIDEDRRMLVGVDETERTYGNHELAVMRDQDLFTGGQRRAIVKESSHFLVDGELREKVSGTRSRTVEVDQLFKVAGRYASYAKQEFHLKAPSQIVLESGFDLTFRGPAGFVRITPSGVIVKGRLVKINSGGEAGAGLGAAPLEPEMPPGADDEETATREDQKEQVQGAEGAPG
ncbi:MAG: type VI secretion system tip protein TssI/VgrG [Polyangiaceae bacterium]